MNVESSAEADDEDMQHAPEASVASATDTDIAKPQKLVKNKMMKLHQREYSGYDVMTGELNVIWSINAPNALRRAGVDQETVMAAKAMQMESKLTGGKGGGVTSTVAMSGISKKLDELATATAASKAATTAQVKAHEKMIEAQAAQAKESEEKNQKQLGQISTAMKLLAERQKEFEVKFQEHAATNQAEQAAAKVATEVAMKASVVAKTEGVNALAAAAHAAMLAEEAKARAETARSDAAEMMTMFMARITGVPAIQSGSPKKELTDKVRDPGCAIWMTPPRRQVQRRRHHAARGRRTRQSLSRTSAITDGMRLPA